jgi:hypothetical protein
MSQLYALMRMKPTQVLAWIALVATNLVIASLLQAVLNPPVVLPERAAVAPGWPSSGCLTANVVPNHNQVLGQAGLCIADDTSTRGTLDLDRLEPNARYVEWIAYFESPSQCSVGATDSQAHNYTGYCTLADLDGPTRHGIVHGVEFVRADGEGVLHVESPLRAINLAPRAEALLLLGQPSWSPVPHPTYRLIEDDIGQRILRAAFTVP